MQSQKKPRSGSSRNEFSVCTGTATSASAASGAFLLGLGNVPGTALHGDVGKLGLHFFSPVLEEGRKLQLRFRVRRPVRRGESPGCLLQSRCSSRSAPENRWSGSSRSSPKIAVLSVLRGIFHFSFPLAVVNPKLLDYRPGQPSFAEALLTYSAIGRRPMQLQWCFRGGGGAWS